MCYLVFLRSHGPEAVAQHLLLIQEALQGVFTFNDWTGVNYPLVAHTADFISATLNHSIGVPISCNLERWNRIEFWELKYCNLPFPLLSADCPDHTDQKAYARLRAALAERICDVVFGNRGLLGYRSSLYVYLKAVFRIRAMEENIRRLTPMSPVTPVLQLARASFQSSGGEQILWIDRPLFFKHRKWRRFMAESDRTLLDLVSIETLNKALYPLGFDAADWLERDLGKGCGKLGLST